jgi:PUA domain protein
MRVKSRHHLKGSEAKKVLATIQPLLSEPSCLKGSSMEQAETDEGVDLIYVNGKPYFMLIEGQPFFTVLGAIELSPNKKLVVVDSGAVKFITNGADVMSPGIVEADPSIEEGDMVVVVEEKHRKPLAIGRALLPGTEMKGAGKAVKSLHHVGDQIWKGLS